MGLVHGDDPERCYGEGGGRGGSCLGTHVRIKDFKIKNKTKQKKIDFLSQKQKKVKDNILSGNDIKQNIILNYWGI